MRRRRKHGSERVTHPESAVTPSATTGDGMQDTTERITKAETRNLQWRRSPETEIGVSRARSSAMAGSWPRKRGTLHQRSEVQSELQNQCVHAYVSRSPSEVLSGRESVGPGISKGFTFSYQVEHVTQGSVPGGEAVQGPGSPKEDRKAVQEPGSPEEDKERGSGAVPGTWQS